MGKKMIVIITLVCILLSACGFRNNHIQQSNGIKDGTYTVLDVRESVGGYVSDGYYITLVLQDDDNNRIHFQRKSSDNKDEEYLSVARLIPGDIVNCQGNIFSLKNESGVN